MYTISNKLKAFSIILIVLGLIGVTYGFMTSHKSLDDVKTMILEEHSAHGGGHAASTASLTNGADESVNESIHAIETKDSNTVALEQHEEVAIENDTLLEESHVMGKDTVHAEVIHSETNASIKEHDEDKEEHSSVEDHGKASHDDEHAEHVQHQLANRPWAALYVAAFFFMMIALGALAFYAIQFAAQAGWSPLLFRVMEGITAYLLPGALIVLGIAVASGTIGHYNLFIWMDPEVVAHDKLIQGKSGFLNMTGFIIRGLIFITGWCTYRFFARKFSIAQDNAVEGDNRNFKKSFRISAAFLVFYIYTESMMSWDWIMSVDPHWFSTLFGWYLFASMIVSSVTVIAMVTMYLKSRGYLPQVNNSHLHDLAKFMFGFSIFWTYLWFSQFMLIWYSNIPEEVTYFVTRIEDYNLPFFGMLILNFIFPLLILMNSDFKRVNLFVIMAGIVILFGHYIDIFNMIMPATVGDRWFIGIPEISSILLFGGLFLFIVFTALTKAPLVAKRNPFIHESEHFHY